MTTPQIMTCNSCFKQLIYVKHRCMKVTIDTGFVANTHIYCDKCFKRIANIIVNERIGQWASVTEDGLPNTERSGDLLIIDSDGFYGIFRENESIESIKNIKYYMILPPVPTASKLV